LHGSAADGVPQNDHSRAEPSLLDQLQVQPYTIREEPFSTSDDHGADDHLELVDKTGPYRVCGEFRTVDSDVVIGVGLEPPDRVGLELTFKRPSRSRRVRLPYSRPAT
jgi:hypothetical protein